MTTAKIESKFIEVEGMQLHYLEAGSGEPVLLVHGWPTSAHLWRNIMPALAQTKRVLAIDLPGFGLSDKPLDRPYTWKFYTKAINGFLTQLGIEQTNLAVHDLGGPIGLTWAVRYPEKVLRLGLLNTLVYPEFSWMVKLFRMITMTPVLRTWFAGPSGIAFSMRVGVHNKKNLTPAVLKPYQEPFQEPAARQALLHTLSNLNPKGYFILQQKLPRFKIPVGIIYGENDRALPDVAQTMARVQKDLPQAIMRSLPNCGHFLQEDEPEQIGVFLAELFNS